MQAAILPPLAGWYWIKSGYALFRRQPVAMLFWSVTTSFIINILGLIPMLGQLVLICITPILTYLTLCACKNIADNQKIKLDTWLYPLKQDGITKILLRLGLVYMAANIIAAFVAVTPFMGSLTSALGSTENPDFDALMQAMSAPLMLFGFLYILISAIFWHTPALIGWHNVPIRKSLFFSTVACWRNKYAIIVYVAFWLGVFYGFHGLIGELLAVGVSTALVAWLSMTLDIFITAILYCSFYEIYTSIFGHQSNY